VTEDTFPVAFENRDDVDRGDVVSWASPSPSSSSNDVTRSVVNIINADVVSFQTTTTGFVRTGFVRTGFVRTDFVRIGLKKIKLEIF